MKILITILVFVVISWELSNAEDKWQSPSKSGFFRVKVIKSPFISPNKNDGVLGAYYKTYNGDLIESKTLTWNIIQSGDKNKDKYHVTFTDTITGPSGGTAPLLTGNLFVDLSGSSNALVLGLSFNSQFDVSSTLVPKVMLNPVEISDFGLDLSSNQIITYGMTVERIDCRGSIPGTWLWTVNLKVDIEI